MFMSAPPGLDCGQADTADDQQVIVRLYAAEPDRVVGTTPDFRQYSCFSGSRAGAADEGVFAFEVKFR
jgi:hypothetical protein